MAQTRIRAALTAEQTVFKIVPCLFKRTRNQICFPDQPCTENADMYEQNNNVNEHKRSMDFHSSYRPQFGHNKQGINFACSETSGHAVIIPRLPQVRPLLRKYPLPRCRRKRQSRQSARRPRHIQEYRRQTLRYGLHD